MKNSVILSVCLFFSIHVLAQKSIGTLYDSSKYSAIIALVESKDSTATYSPLEFYRIGRSYYNEDMPADALKYFNKALAAGRDSANVHFFIGSSYKYLKEYDKAILALNEAIKRDSTDQYAWCERGQVRFSQQKFDLAIQDLERAVQCPKEYSAPYFLLFYNYFVKEDYENAEKTHRKWQKEIDSDEKDQIYSLRLLGEMERDRKKNYKKAADYFTKVLDKTPLSIKAYEDLLITHTRAEAWKKVDKVFEKLKDKHAEKRLNDDDTKRTAAVVDRFAFNDTTFVIIIRYFKKPTEFADPIYQAYIDDSRTDSTFMRIQTEKSIDLFGKGEELHMLCGWQGKAHLNFGPITRNGKVKYEEFKERLMGILEKKRKPGITTTTTNKN